MGRSARRSITVVTALVLIAVACTGGNDAVPATTTSPTTTIVIPQRITDERLTIGLLLPTTDPLIGQGLVSSATDAIDRVNQAGGVLDQSIRLITADEGSTTATARDGIALLLDEGVDAIVGPSSSLIALSTLDDLVSAGIVSCSPTASALALDDFPDNGLFFRTIPSDSLQAVAIAEVAERTGVQNVAVVYVDDAYGRPFAAAVEGALVEGTRSITTVTPYPFVRSEGLLEDLAKEVTESDARVVIVLAGADDGAAFLEAMSRTNFGSLTQVVVNDALRNPTSQQLIETLDSNLRDLVRGVAPQAQSNDEQNPFDPPGLFAANAFDCVNLVALAVNLVRSDDPTLFASQIPALTTGGRVCTAFAPCAELLDEGLDINYNGPDGITELLQAGYPSRARFDQFRFDETGRAVFIAPLVSSSR